MRRAARDIYRARATLNTQPTLKGKALINPFHPLFGLHWLKDKPLADLFTKDKSLYARLHKAEVEGLITLKISPPPDPHDPSRIDANLFLHDLQFFNFFMPTLKPFEDPNPEVREAWDTIRVCILSDAIERHLAPSLEAEARRELMRISRETIALEAAKEFSKMLSVGPFRSSEVSIRDVLLKCPEKPVAYTVASIFCSSEPKSPLCMAFIDVDGVVKAHSVLPAEAISQKRDRISQFLKDNKPNVIVLNASGGDASRNLLSQLERFLVNEVANMLEKEAADRRAEREDNYYMDEGEEEEEVRFAPKVVLINDHIAQIFAQSRRSKAKVTFNQSIE